MYRNYPTDDARKPNVCCRGRRPLRCCKHAGAVPFTSTIALTNATIPYALELADKGWQRAVRENRELWYGLNFIDGHITYRAVADAFGMEYTDPATLL